MEPADKNGLMVHVMKANGVKAKQMAMANYFMLMVTSTKVNGSMTKPMEKEPTLMQMERNMLASGKMISNMARDWKPGQIALCMKATILKEKSMVKEN